MKACIQLWSYNYDPEPTGIGPVSTALARGLVERDWNVEVIAAHPHYPEPKWGRALRPYRELRDGIPVTRLPIWPGRNTPGQRIRQELSYTAALSAVTPLLGRGRQSRPAAMVVVSPSFPALLPAVAKARFGNVPMVLWLHDLLPDGAVATDQLTEGGAMMCASRWLERTTYAAADRIVVLARSFTGVLEKKGIPGSKIELVYDPATRGVPLTPPGHAVTRKPTVLCMGNIGHSQGLAPLVRAWESSSEIPRIDASLVITGTGVAADEVSREIRSHSVELTGVLSDEQLEGKLNTANLALVSQAYEGTQFNLPCKVMNYMAYALPIIAAVNPAGEVADLVRSAGAGWVVDSSDPDAFPTIVATALADSAEMMRRGNAGHQFAGKHFSPAAFADRFDAILMQTAHSAISR